MTRYKWYRVGHGNNFSQFIKKIASKSLAPSEPAGFVTLPSENGRSVFRFLYRSNLMVVTFDSDGNPDRQLVSTVDHCNFSAFERAGCSWLRIEDPPRSLRELLNSLEAASGMGFFAEPVIFSEQRQASILKKAHECRMVGFKGVGTSTQLKVVTRIEVASKEGIRLEDMDFLRGLDYTVDHASYEVVYERVKAQVTFTSSGAVKISGQLMPFIVGLIEGQLSAKSFDKPTARRPE